jgi:biotin carboxyl carrier protein
VTTVLHAGEVLSVPERMVVAPASGIFQPAPPVTVTAEGELVHAGQVIGAILGPGVETPVVSPFDGFLMGMLAAPGERLRPGEPVAWLRAP